MGTPIVDSADAKAVRSRRRFRRIGNPFGMAAPERGRWANIFALARGTVLAQLVFVLATPVLMRIYSAEELGIFGVLAALVLVLAPFVSLKYEYATMLPRRSRMAAHVVVLTTLAGIVVLALFLASYATLLGVGWVSREDHALHGFPFVVTLAVLLFVANETLVSWFIRRREFSVIANARLLNAAALAILQLLGVLVSERLIVLLAAYPLALALSVAYLYRQSDLRAVLGDRLRARWLKILAWRYREFPFYMTWSSAIFELSQALPLFVLSAMFGNAQAGYFFIARRIGLVPTSVVGRAITQVNHAELVDHWRQGTIEEPMVRQIHLLQWLAVVPAISLGLAAPWLCAWALGDEWRNAGYYLAFMTPYVLVRFVFAPIQAINHVAEWQRLAFWFEIVTTALSVGALLLFAYRGDPASSVAAYFAVQCVANLVYRVHLLRRLEISPARVLWPTALQLAVLGSAALILQLATSIDLATLLRVSASTT